MSVDADADASCTIVMLLLPQSPEHWSLPPALSGLPGRQHDPSGVLCIHLPQHSNIQARHRRVEGLPWQVGTGVCRRNSMLTTAEHSFAGTCLGY